MGLMALLAILFCSFFSCISTKPQNEEEEEGETQWHNEQITNERTSEGGEYAYVPI